MTRSLSLITFYVALFTSSFYPIGGSPCVPKKMFWFTTIAGHGGHLETYKRYIKAAVMSAKRRQEEFFEQHFMHGDWQASTIPQAGAPLSTQINHQNLSLNCRHYRRGTESRVRVRSLCRPWTCPYPRVVPGPCLMCVCV
jgi:hypothetical protein